MPWTAESFRSKHNHRLSSARAQKAANTANEVLARTGDEITAIVAANRQAKHDMPDNVRSAPVRSRTHTNFLRPARPDHGEAR